MYICVTVNINESARPLVLMVTLAECDVLIDLGGCGVSFSYLNLAAR